MQRCWISVLLKERWREKQRVSSARPFNSLLKTKSFMQPRLFCEQLARILHFTETKGESLTGENIQQDWGRIASAGVMQLAQPVYDGHWWFNRMLVWNLCPKEIANEPLFLHFLVAESACTSRRCRQKYPHVVNRKCCPSLWFLLT